MSKTLKISVSFKEKEKYLYEYLMTKISATVYIKELILNDMKGNRYKDTKKEINSSGGFDF